MRYLLIALLSAVLFGAATPASKALLSSFGPIQLAGLLYLGAAIGVAPLALRKSLHTAGAIDRVNLLRLGGAILFGGVMAPVFLLLGLMAASAASVSLWLPMELVATAVIGVLIFKDHLGTYGWLGMAGVIGASLMLGLGEGPAGLGAGLWVLAACVFWGFDNNLTAVIDGITPAQITFWKGLFAGVINIGLGFAAGERMGPMDMVGPALVVGALAYGASIALYVTAARNIGASRAQMFFASGPFFGAALSALALGESFSALQTAAAILLAGSLALVFRDRHEHEHAHEAAEHEHSHSHDDAHHEHAHEGETAVGPHTHRHRHDPVRHSHTHLPDLHHRHSHGSDGGN